MISNLWQCPVESFALTAVLTPAAKLLLEKFGFWNAKDGEHPHVVVRGGGIAIALSFILAGAFISQVAIVQADLLRLFPRFLLAAVFLLITGVADDRWGLRARKKLLLQALAILLLWLGGFRIHYFLIWSVNDFWSIMLTVFWGVSVLNAFNLIDGLDGLCTGNAMIAAGAFLVLAMLTRNQEVMVISLLLGGCCAGFLIYNFHPAKIFLGDTGSLFLGLVCTALSLRINEGIFNVTNTAALLLIFWIPFCDMGLAVWRRKVKALLRSCGCQIMGRDLYHLHYRLKNLIHSHAWTVAIMWAGMCAFDFFALMIFVMSSSVFTMAAFTAIGLFSLLTMARYEISYTLCLIRHSAERMIRKLAA